MKRSTLWHLCSQEGNTACCDYSVKYGCTHCNCIPSNALIDTFYITCNFMDILIATNYLCLGLLQYSSFQCICFISVMLFSLWLSKCSTKLLVIYVEGCIYTDKKTSEMFFGALELLEGIFSLFRWS